MKDYYGILGIEQNASSKEIERTYATLIEKYHPGNFSGEAKKIVEDRIEDIKEAYSVLSDDFLRNQYDKEIGIVSSVRPKAPSKNKNSQTREINSNRRNLQSKAKEANTEYEEERPKKEKSTLGTIKGVKNVAEVVFSNLPKIKFRKPEKKGVLALLAAIAIILVLGLILWFIPFTNGFMRSFLLMN